MATCNCNTEGYSPDCPQAFMQGGKLMHTLDGDTRLKPRVYELEKRANRTSPKSESDPFQYLTNSVMATTPPDDDASIFPLSLTERNNHENTLRSADVAESRRFMTDVDMRAENRVSMDRFKPLTVGDRTLTDISIGGFQLDLTKVAEKARHFIELPPAVLPIIFIDKELNFSHHFFQGMEKLLGRSEMKKIVDAKKYSESDQKKVLPVIKRLIMEGYLETDNELSVFVKKVLTVTFDTIATSKLVEGTDALLVATNAYGFQYIEQGMQCNESELKMWLHVEYMRFKMLWFNAFKSSGIPAFAENGVQERYESDQRTKNERMYERELKKVEASLEQNYRDDRSREMVPYKTRHTSKSKRNYTIF